jgi:hypothetical protein
MQSEAINELAAALAKAQGSFTAIKKDKTARVRMKSGGEYQYSYADLASVLEAVRKPLADNGLACVQAINLTDNGLILQTRILHSSGQWIGSTYPLPAGGAAQEMGSAQTYARRYALCALVGIVAEDDDDGAGAEETKPRQNKPHDPSPPPEPPPTAPTYQLMHPKGRVASRHERPSLFLSALEEEMRGAKDPHVWWAINGAQAKAIAEQFPQAKEKVAELEEAASFGRTAAA